EPERRPEREPARRAHLPDRRRPDERGGGRPVHPRDEGPQNLGRGARDGGAGGAGAAERQHRGRGPGGPRQRGSRRLSGPRPAPDAPRASPKQQTGARQGRGMSPALSRPAPARLPDGPRGRAYRGARYARPATAIRPAHSPALPARYSRYRVSPAMRAEEERMRILVVAQSILERRA